LPSYVLRFSTVVEVSEEWEITIDADSREDAVATLKDLPMNVIQERADPIEYYDPGEEGQPEIHVLDVEEAWEDEEGEDA
jgi:hypothetical protein